MRRSSQIGFGASVGLAIFSASFVADVSSERKWSSFWPQASAGISNLTALIPYTSEMPDWSDRRTLPDKIRRRDLLNRVHQKLSRPSEPVDSILP
jgi:hypothetical protein